MAAYAITIFLSAFLLFQVQPLIGKFILPWFGGGPAVWTACMLFFQVLLLVGYAYAHATTRIKHPKTRAWLHVAVLTASLLTLPIIPSAELWKPCDSSMPVWRILLLLTATVGAPYFVLSTTGPLLQDWFARSHPGRSPYRLYALSNLGSLLALLSYPFAVEPHFRLRAQAFSWSVGYGVFALLCAWLALRYAKSRAGEAQIITEVVDGNKQAQGKPDAPPPPEKVRRGDILLWLLLPCAGSVALLATTNYLCQDMAVVPFLWIMPLAVYLITFIIAFDSPRWYLRNFVGLLLLFGAVGLVLYMLNRNIPQKLPIQIINVGVALFFICMACHGELSRLRPPAERLTLYYLLIAAGGALGGVLVVLVAPAIFTNYWEFHISLAAAVLLALICHMRDPKSRLHGLRPVWAWVILGGLFIGMATLLGANIKKSSGDAVDRSRNFYGVLKVRETEPDYRKLPGLMALQLSHGSTNHGFQFKDLPWRREPTSYYGPTSGVALALNYNPRRFAADNTLNIGVIGLGTGTVAAFGRHGDNITFYEINPEVERLSAKYFTYRRESPATMKLVMGDARISIEREVCENARKYDVLAVDAFSSDAIPMHLLTKECGAYYFRRLKPDGILAVHISNRYLDLRPVVRGLAAEFGREAVLVDPPEKDLAPGCLISEWVLVTANEEFLNSATVRDYSTPWPSTSRQILLWTDDYGALYQILRSMNEDDLDLWTPVKEWFQDLFHPRQ